MTLSMFRRTAGLTGLALVMSVALAMPALAQSSDQPAGLGLKGLGIRLGLTDPEDASSALMYGVHLDAGTLVRNVHIIPSVEYWSVGNDVGLYSADYSDLAAKVDINFDFPLQDQRLVPYLGGGLGLHRIKFSTNVPGDFDASDTKLGLSVQGGMRNDFTPNLSLFGELGYAFVENANQLRLLGGFTYHFIY
jgi:opacity protein-like surface antigen